MSVRQAVEQRSVPVLLALSRQPRWLIALGAVALFAGLLLLPSVPAALCLLALLVVVGWLTFLSWPALDGGARLLRVVVAVGLLVLGLSSVR